MTVPRAASAKAFFVRLLSEVERDVDKHVFLAADHPPAAYWSRDVDELSDKVLRAMCCGQIAAGIVGYDTPASE
jgi:hypothetical protein